jgi:hypothetical protein
LDRGKPRRLLGLMAARVTTAFAMAEVEVVAVGFQGWELQWANLVWR